MKSLAPMGILGVFFSKFRKSPADTCLSYWYLATRWYWFLLNIILFTADIGTFFGFCFTKNHYAPISQANWCNMTFTAGNLFPSHTCIGVTRVKPPPGLELGSPVWLVDDLPTGLSLPTIWPLLIPVQWYLKSTWYLTTWIFDPSW